MNGSTCCKCSKVLPPGSTKYILSIRLYADFDENMDSSSEYDFDSIEELIHSIEKLGKEEMEEDVHQEMAFILCGDCRKSFCKNPLNREAEKHGKSGEYQGILH